MQMVERSRPADVRPSRAPRVVAALLAAALFGVSAVARADTWPALTAAPHVEGDASKDAALIIGIDQYAFVPHVEGATSNARDWFTFVVNGQKMPISRAHLLQNNDGTREQILGMAKKVAGEVELGGRLWLVFIGHGAPSADGKDGMLVGVDAQQTANGLYARSVSQRELLDAVSGGAQASTVLVVDACFSGRTGSGAPLAPGLQPLVRVKESGPLKAGKSDTLILSAGTSDQFAGPLPGANRPAFSYLVLGALRGWADKSGKGEISAQDAVDYAKLVMTVLPLGRTQTPELTAAKAKVLLSRGARERGPELSRIVTTQPPAPSESKAPKSSAAPVGPAIARLRLRAICGDSPEVLARQQALVVEEITDASDQVLEPASSVDAELRYDEATRTRKMQPPEFVDFELPPGEHRVRVKAKGCKPVEERLTLDSSTTFEFAPHLETIVIPLVPVAFTRPAFADSADVLRIRGSDGEVVCEDLPCVAIVPAAEQRFAIGWTKGGGGVEISARLPDPPEAAKDAKVQGNVTHDRSHGPGPVLIAGGLLDAVAMGVAFFAVKSTHECLYEGTTNTSLTVTQVKADGLCGDAPPGFRPHKQTESITGAGAAVLAVGGVGLAVAALGGVMTALKIGGTDSMSVRYTAHNELSLTPTGVGGTF